MSTADMRALAPPYLANAALRLQAFMDTGKYVRDVPGVVAIDT